MRTEQTLPLVVARSGAPSALGTNPVLRNTYGLLSATLLFSPAVAAASAALQFDRVAADVHQLDHLLAEFGGIGRV